MGSRVIVSPASLLSMFDADINPVLSIGLVHGEQGLGGPTFLISEWNGSIHPRVVATQQYIEHLYRLRPPSREPDRDRTLTLLQAEDIPYDAKSVSWQARTAWTGVQLIPDLYYFENDGYEGFLSPRLYDLPAWRYRRNSAIWRGTTTGAEKLTVSSAGALPRVRLCRATRSFGPSCDVAITGVTQAVSEDEKTNIEAMLSSEGLLGGFVPFRQMGFFKFVIDIDGNASSWNFLAKLRLGSCMIKVESDWCQWFTARLIPWQHYVPVASDLLDLEEKLDWCFSNSEEAERIAHAGREFALGFSPSRELAAASRTIFERPATCP